MKRCPNMKRIGLAANEINESGARALAPFIRDHACLEEINITATASAIEDAPRLPSRFGRPMLRSSSSR